MLAPLISDRLISGTGAILNPNIRRADGAHAAGRLKTPTRWIAIPAVRAPARAQQRLQIFAPLPSVLKLTALLFALRRQTRWLESSPRLAWLADPASFLLLTARTQPVLWLARSRIRQSFLVP